MGGLALIGAILCGLWLLFGADAGIKTRQRQANKAYKEDYETHNYNDDLQFKILNGKDEMHYPCYQELWDLVDKCKLSCRIAQDAVMAKKLRDKGYDFNPRHANFDPLKGTDGYKNIELGTRLYEEYRQKVYSLVDKYIEKKNLSDEDIKEMEAMRKKYEPKITYDLNGLKTVEYRLPRYK